MESATQRKVKGFQLPLLAYELAYELRGEFAGSESPCDEHEREGEGGDHRRTNERPGDHARELDMVVLQNKARFV